MHIAVVGEPELADLLPLMRAYCDFYGVGPDDDALLGLGHTLVADPDGEGFQLIAAMTRAAPSVSRPSTGAGPPWPRPAPGS